MPLNYSYLTRTPYVGEWQHADARRQRAARSARADQRHQRRTAVGVPCAPGAPPAACGTPAQAAQAKANRSIYNGLAPTFDLRHRRDTAAFGLTYAATQGDRCRCERSRRSRQEGQQPWGASFAFNNAVELPQPDRPADQRRVARAHPGRIRKAMFRLGLGRVVVQQRHPEARLGQPDPGHRLQQRPGAARSGPTTRAATATATARPRDGWRSRRATA